MMENLATLAIGMAIGFMCGIAAAWILRTEEEDDASWQELLQQQDRYLAQIQHHNHGPKAITRIANNERVIEI